MSKKSNIVIDTNIWVSFLIGKAMKGLVDLVIDRDVHLIFSPELLDDQVTICRDEKDNFLLDLCLAGNVDYLVTGDPDLLDLDPFNNTRIISYRDFEREITD